MPQDLSPREQRNCERRLMRQLAKSEANLQKTKARLTVVEKVSYSIRTMAVQSLFTPWLSSNQVKILSPHTGTVDNPGACH